MIREHDVNSNLSTCINSLYIYYLKKEKKKKENTTSKKKFVEFPLQSIDLSISVTNTFFLFTFKLTGRRVGTTYLVSISPDIVYRSISYPYPIRARAPAINFSTFIVPHSHTRSYLTLVLPLFSSDISIFSVNTFSNSFSPCTRDPTFTCPLVYNERFQFGFPRSFENARVVLRSVFPRYFSGFRDRESESLLSNCIRRKLSTRRVRVGKSEKIQRSLLFQFLLKYSGRMFSR